MSEQAKAVVATAREHFGLGGDPRQPEGSAEVLKVRIYPANPANAFDTGAMLDLRVRMAAELLTHSSIYQGVVLKAASMEEVAQQPRVLATHALDLATALIEIGTERGLVRPLAIDDPESPLSKEDMARLVDQGALMGSFNATNQTSAQTIIAKFQREQQMGIAVPQAPGSSRPS